jgi:hypothetical protein
VVESFCAVKMMGSAGVPVPWVIHQRVCNMRLLLCSAGSDSVASLLVQVDWFSCREYVLILVISFNFSD